MPIAVGIKLDPESFPKFFNPADFRLDENDFCVVRDEQGHEQVGYVVCFEGRCAMHMERLASIVRMAGEEEIGHWHDTCRRGHEALVLVRSKVVEHGLPMKIISVQFKDEQNIVIFYFTADHRIDFRELVRDLAGTFKSRIELWQIGSRQGSAEKDGYGHCGQRLCCATWMHNFPPISIRQAREQDINHSPPKLSGLCGRLRCCLHFEHETYCALRQGATPVGATVCDHGGREGQVIDRNLITGQALVQFEKSKMEWLTFARLTVLKALVETKESAIAIEEDEPIVNDDETRYSN